MQVLDKKKLLLSTLLLIIIPFYNTIVYADNLERIKIEYSNQNYNEVIKLLNIEIEKNPNNAEAYKLLGLSYEAIFDIPKSIEAYNKYEEIKNKGKISTNISPLPKISPVISPSPINNLDKIKSLPIPSVSPTASSSIIPVPSNSISPLKNLPSLKPTPIPKLVKKNNNKFAVKINTEGFESLKVNKIEKKKSINIIPKNSLDLKEIEIKAKDNERFFLVNCNIKYSKNIILKNNSEQVSIKDTDNKTYNLFAINTFIFRYEGNEVAKKFEAIQDADYYQLSLKELRNNITFIFKINNNSIIKSLHIRDYKDIDISNLEILI